MSDKDEEDLRWALNVGADIIQSYMERLPLDLTHAEGNSLSSVIPSEAESRVEKSLNKQNYDRQEH